jgi:hypothetical protein
VESTNCIIVNVFSFDCLLPLVQQIVVFVGEMLHDATELVYLVALHSPNEANASTGSNAEICPKQMQKAVIETELHADVDAHAADEAVVAVDDDELIDSALMWVQAQIHCLSALWSSMAIRLHWQ